ncbi:uncharacterized protein [Linepithema humile]|uniref:uncharacterized protein isoform X2 n=2 Tax=Linepithema humile TaxID=83485 RepID=UPI00351E64CA
MSDPYIFPNEILEIIFNLCDVCTLYQLTMVCKQFNNVANDTLNKKSKHLFTNVNVTNQKSKKFYERCKPELSSYNSIFTTYYNWIYTTYKKSNITETIKEIYGGYRANKCLQMTKNTVWFCKNDNVLAYNRAKDGTIKKDEKIVGNNNTFVTSIALCDDYIISGDLNGIIKHWRIESEKDRRNDLKYSEIHDVNTIIESIDATSQHIITASKNLIKLLKYTDDKTGCTKKNEIYCGVGEEGFENNSRVKSISFDPIGTKFAAGCYSYNKHLSSFLIYDIEKSDLVMDKNCEGLFRQLLWEDPHTVLMCFDQSIKKMDMRVSDFVRTWNSSQYEHSFCCSSDNMYTFMTGHSVCVLWDQRQSVAIQKYDVPKNSFIEFLEFDSAHIYAVTYRCLYELDFTGTPHFDYKAIKKLFGNFY